jgi:2-polyprenyl-3-methyl-5-hydroxy-6-metoxy-1,4-benzoquinol methylase
VLDSVVRVPATRWCEMAANKCKCRREIRAHNNQQAFDIAARSMQETAAMEPASATSPAPPSRPWPDGGLERVPECPICGGRERTLAHRGLRDRLFFAAPGTWDMYCCEACSSGYLDPRPDAATIGLAYSAYYTHSTGINAEQPPRSVIRRHRIAQRNAYLNRFYGYKLSPANAWPPFPISTARRQRWEKQIGYLEFPGRGARLLDVGCGQGRFMAQMRAAGWLVTGVEPDPVSAARAISAGLDVRTGPIETLSAVDDEQFDAVSLHHVIEHLHRPLETLRRCREVLKTGGTLVVATPNFISFCHGKLGADWFPLSPPTHLVMFTPNSLRQALQAAGFEPETSYRMRVGASEVVRRSFHIRRRGDPMQMKPPLSVVDRLRAAWLARQADRATLAQPLLAEELVILARKNP